MKNIWNKKWFIRFSCILVGLFSIVLSLFFVGMLLSCKMIVSHYNVEAKVKEPIKIVLLTDLHNQVYGHQNEEIVEKTKAENPDLIFIVGDMIDEYSKDLSVVINLITDLKDTAPIFYSYGNKEFFWSYGKQRRYIYEEGEEGGHYKKAPNWKERNYDLKEILEKAGAHVLEVQYADVVVKGSPLRIGGQYGYYRAPQMEEKDPKKRDPKLKFAEAFEKTERQKILLSHIPTPFLDWQHRDQYDCGLVFSGHYHGGQIVFPFSGRGLYIPNSEGGRYSIYTRGVFPGKKSTCILSAGLGSEYAIPRVYNPPEIVSVTLVPKGK